MVYTFSDRQLRKLKGYFNKMRGEKKPGYDVETLNKAPDHRLFCEYFEGVARGYIKDEEFFSKYHPTSHSWFYDELLMTGPQVITRTKVVKYLQAIESGKDPESSRPRKKRNPASLPAQKPREETTPASRADTHPREKKQPKQLISMKIDPDLYERAKAQAENEQRTFGSLVRFLLAQHIQKNS